MSDPASRRRSTVVRVSLTKPFHLFTRYPTPRTAPRQRRRRVNQEEIAMSIRSGRRRRRSKDEKTLHIATIDSLGPFHLMDSPTAAAPSTGLTEEKKPEPHRQIASQPPPWSLSQILKGRAEMIRNRTVDWALGEYMAFWVAVERRDPHRDCRVDELGPSATVNTSSTHQNVNKEDLHSMNHLLLTRHQTPLCNSHSPSTESSSSELLLLLFIRVLSASSSVHLPGQAKWVRQIRTGCCRHGMEGMGPEHSSARPEILQSNDAPDVMPLSPAPRPGEGVSRSLNHDLVWCQRSTRTRVNNDTHAVEPQPATGNKTLSPDGAKAPDTAHLDALKDQE
ncbi:2-oxoglutarate dehydrogenase, mitochondrial [Lates japonicus]|uniref:oxoglutarate dehydrogenase (succinyl-transferring) n=1 Tax=Lates japonicus TaxID=270547 RepID=A0AAD3NJV3_LATJO|nr:2-oxoglutarate dehydrogenase, mitochondrial [Lates japonicus]